MLRNNVVENLVSRNLELEKDYILSKIEEMRAGWIEATQGNMDAVTLNLNLLFQDIREIIAGGEDAGI